MNPVFDESGDDMFYDDVLDSPVTLSKQERVFFKSNTKKCARCKKEIFKLSFKHYAYKKQLGGTTKYFCSWSCLRADERRK